MKSLFWLQSDHPGGKHRFLVHASLRGQVWKVPPCKSHGVSPASMQVQLPPFRWKQVWPGAQETSGAALQRLRPGGKQPFARQVSP